MFSIIIVDYKSLPKTLEYVLSCQRALAAREEIHYIVVDNDSDTKLEEQRAKFSTELKKVGEHGRQPIFQTTFRGQAVVYVKAASNGGYGKGNNLGAKVSQKLFGDAFLIFSNNDLVFRGNYSLEKMIEPLQIDKRIGAVGPRIVGLDGKSKNPSSFRGMFRELFGDYFLLLLPKVLKHEKKENFPSIGMCDWVSGSFMLVDAEKFSEVEGFDENIFLYMEETVLARKFERAGYGMYYDDRMYLIHNHSETIRNTIGIVKGIQHEFDSKVYYYRTYQHVSDGILSVAKFFFKINLCLFKTKKQLLSFIRK